MNKRKNSNVKQRICSASVVAMLAFSLLIAVTAPAVADPGWLAGWSYREPVNISSSSVLTDYQVNVTVDTAGLILDSKMQLDGDDIRFTDSDGTTLLNYGIESGINTDTTKIWVNVSSVSTSGTTIYMYYGNLSASSVSNGTATFEFFDDFDNVDNWEYQTFYNWGDNHTIFSVSNGSLVITSSDNNRAGPTTKAAQLSQGQKFEARVVTRSGSANTIQLLYQSYGNTYENIPYAPNVYEVWIAQNHVGTKLYGPGPGEDVSSNPYIEYMTTDYVHFGTREKGEVYNENSAWDTANFKLAFYTYSLGTIEIDWVFVRKYVCSEPGVTIGSEEEKEPSQQPIPEFSSIAIPVAAILGLLFLFNYRKQRRN